ncbi:MAG: hypothetical protein IPO60_14750 [Flavobacteriales bacterium]|nr:hypothetical protein [Flavobacteriales bacterium]
MDQKQVPVHARFTPTVLLAVPVSDAAQHASNDEQGGGKPAALNGVLQPLEYLIEQFIFHAAWCWALVDMIIPASVLLSPQAALFIPRPWVKPIRASNSSLRVINSA